MVSDCNRDARAGFGAANGSVSADRDILRQRFESLSIWLHNGNRDMAGFSGFDISHRARFSDVDATDDFAWRAVTQFSWGIRFHLH